MWVFVHEHNKLKLMSMCRSQSSTWFTEYWRLMGSHPYQVPQKAKNTAYCKMYAHCIRPENRYNSVVQVHKLWVEIEEDERKQACTHLSETMGLKWNSVLMFFKCNTKRQIFLIQNSHFRNRTNKQTKKLQSWQSTMSYILRSFYL